MRFRGCLFKIDIFWVAGFWRIKPGCSRLLAQWLCCSGIVACNHQFIHVWVWLCICTLTLSPILSICAKNLRNKAVAHTRQRTQGTTHTKPFTSNMSIAAFIDFCRNIIQWEFELLRGIVVLLAPPCSQACPAGSRLEVRGVAAQAGLHCEPVSGRRAALALQTLIGFDTASGRWEESFSFALFFPTISKRAYFV